jgi:uncharacterized protein YprB with RNaseH-like and TPR domain
MKTLEATDDEAAIISEALWDMRNRLQTWSAANFDAPTVARDAVHKRTIQVRDVIQHFFPIDPSEEDPT